MPQEKGFGHYFRKQKLFDHREIQLVIIVEIKAKSKDRIKLKK